VPPGPTDGLASDTADIEQLLLIMFVECKFCWWPTGGIWSWTCSGSKGATTPTVLATKGLDQTQMHFLLIATINISLLPAPWVTVAGGGFAVSSNDCVANEITHGSNMYTPFHNLDHTRMTYDNIGITINVFEI